MGGGRLSLKKNSKLCSMEYFYLFEKNLLYRVTNMLKLLRISAPRNKISLHFFTQYIFRVSKLSAMDIWSVNTIQRKKLFLYESNRIFICVKITIFIIAILVGFFFTVKLPLGPGKVSHYFVEGYLLLLKRNCILKRN